MLKDLRDKTVESLEVQRNILAATREIGTPGTKNAESTDDVVLKPKL